MISYIKNFFKIIWNKVTTYVALLTGFVYELPDLISSYWAGLEKAIPHLVVYHNTVVVIGILATIWTRVRRDLKAMNKG